MLLIISRTLKEAISNLVRNGWLSVAAITVLLLSLYVVSLLFVITKTTDGILENVQDKINISVYFKTDVSEETILKVKDEMSGWNEIESTDYISRDRAYEDFKKSSEDKPTIMKSLEILGYNPLWASLVIKAKNPNDYPALVGKVSESSFKDDISRVNYEQNKEQIEKLNSSIHEIKNIGISLVILFSFISILITFNTVRITIYTHKNEIEVMRLVGASNTFIRLPFIFEGIIYAVFAMIISTVLLFLSIKFVMPRISSELSALGLLTTFYKNFPVIIGLELLVSVLLGVVSSMIAIRRYLKI